MAKLDQYSYCFILTYGRSGSTVLMRLLNQAPGFQIRGENRNALFHLFRALRAVQGSRQRFGHRRRSDADPWFGADTMNSRGFERECLEAFVENVLSPSEDATVLGFKEINHLPEQMSDEEFEDYVRFLLNRFPGAQIVFITRQADQVARSGWFRNMDTSYVIGQVEAASRRFRELAARDRRCFVIDYADLVQQRARLNAMFDWLGLEVADRDVADVLSTRLTHMNDTGLRRLLRRLAHPWLLRASFLLPDIRRNS